jgi:hypothetical protein
MGGGGDAGAVSVAYEERRLGKRLETRYVIAFYRTLDDRFPFYRSVWFSGIAIGKSRR